MIELGMNEFMKNIRFPIPTRFKSELCFFFVFGPDSEGDINVTLRLNTACDQNTYRWVYANVNSCDMTDLKAFFKPLVLLYDELQHLEFSWKKQEKYYADGKYIKRGVLNTMPVADK